jgi:citrate synthase
MEIRKGLEGVYVDVTAISNVEGEVGRLSYRGYSIEDLISLDYAAVVWLVLFGEIPTADQQRWLETALNALQTLDAGEQAVIAGMSRQLHPMAALQALVPLAQTGEAALDNPFGLGAEALEGIALVAKLAALLAGFYQHQQQRPLRIDNSAATYHGNFIANFTGAKPTAEAVTLLDITQILQMEHSFNASTFTCRVAASTLAPLKACVSAAIGALSGPLHGGADEAALHMAERVGSPAQAEAFVRETLRRKEKIMGMGHREYRTVDPRAKVLKPLARQLCRGTPQEPLLQTLEAIETAFRAAMLEQNKDLWANVDFYKGPVFKSIGIPPAYFTAMFALARTVGYVAHVLESRADNKLIRPKAQYTGPAFRRLPARDRQATPTT